MTQHKVNAIIKVGKSSDIKFNNVRAYRAMNYREVEGMLTSKDDISFVVFEDVKEDDVVEINNILESFNILGVIYNRHTVNPDIANKVNIKTIEDLKELQVHIEKELNISVATFKRDLVTDLVTDSTSKINEIENKDAEEHIKIDKQEEFSEAVEALNNNFEVEIDTDEEQVINADIMSKDDIDDSFDFDSIFKDHEDTDIAATKTLDDLENIDKYEGEIGRLNEQLEHALENIHKLTKVKDKLEDDLESYKQFIDRIRESEDVIEVTSKNNDNADLKEEIDSLQDKINQLSIELDEANKLKDTIKELRASLDIKDKNIEELKHTIEDSDSNKIIDELNHRVALEVKSRLFVTQGLTVMTNELLNTQEALSNKMKEVGKLLNEYRELEISLNDTIKEKESLSLAKQETEISLGNQVAILSDKVTKLTLETADMRQKINISDINLGEKDAEITRLKEELDSTKEVLIVTQQIVNDQSNEVHRFEAMGVDDMHTNVLALEESNSTLAEEIGKLRRDKDELDRQIKLKDNDINRINEEKRALTISLKSAAKKIGIGESMKIKCDYSGKAFILPVFGSGSYGITATAVSLANELKGNVLIMDLDVVNPKVDTWYGKNPLNRDLPDIDNDLKKTAFGALVEKGLDYIIEHRLDIVTTVSQTRNNESRVDYFSGIYTRIDMFKLLAVDFSGLLTYFGNEYDYIVVDLGRIGGSEISNALIRMFDEISFKNIAVGLHDGADCRSLSIKVQAERINRTKTLWVLNLAKSDKMDNLMKSSIASANYIIMGRDMKIYGERTPYNKVNILKDRLKKLVDLILQ